MVDEVTGQSTTPPAPQQLLDLEKSVASAIANEPETQTSATGGEILNNPVDDAEHEQAVFNSGQELAARLERQNLAYQNQLAEQNKTMGAMQQKIDTMSSSLNNVQSNIPQNRELTPGERHRLTPEELAEIETIQPGVEKIAATQAETYVQQLKQDFEAKLNEQQTSFNKTIEELRAQQTLQGQVSRTQYDTAVLNTGVSLGLDVNTLPNDPKFVQFLQQKESDFSDTTLFERVQNAEQTGNAKDTAKVLHKYAQLLAAENNTGTPNAGLTGNPQGMGSPGAGMPYGGQQQAPVEESPEVRLNNQRQNVHNQRQQLNQQMSQRTISPDEYRTQIYKLDQLDAQLITAHQNLMGEG